MARYKGQRGYKCDACEHKALEYSPFLKAYVCSCDRAVCEYEPKKNDKLKVIPRDRKQEEYVLRRRG